MKFCFKTCLTGLLLVVLLQSVDGKDDPGKNKLLTVSQLNDMINAKLDLARNKKKQVENPNSEAEKTPEKLEELKLGVPKIPNINENPQLYDKPNSEKRITNINKNQNGNFKSPKNLKDSRSVPNPALTENKDNNDDPEKNGRQETYSSIEESYERFIKERDDPSFKKSHDYNPFDRFNSIFDENFPFKKNKFAGKNGKKYPVKHENYGPEHGKIKLPYKQNKYVAKEPGKEYSDEYRDKNYRDAYKDKSYESGYDEYAKRPPHGYNQKKPYEDSYDYDEYAKRPSYGYHHKKPYEDIYGYEPGYDSYGKRPPYGYDHKLPYSTYSEYDDYSDKKNYRRTAADYHRDFILNKGVHQYESSSEKYYKIDDYDAFDQNKYLNDATGRILRKYGSEFDDLDIEELKRSGGLIEKLISKKLHYPKTNHFWNSVFLYMQAKRV